ncbi:hypothetical protein VTK26DRAFT_3175 [Humicola hyalothermophila]
MLFDADRLPADMQPLARPYRLPRARRERLVFKVLLSTPDGAEGVGWGLGREEGRWFRELRPSAELIRFDADKRDRADKRRA